MSRAENPEPELSRTHPDAIALLTPNAGIGDLVTASPAHVIDPLTASENTVADHLLSFRIQPVAQSLDSVYPDEWMVLEPANPLERPSSAVDSHVPSDEEIDQLAHEIHRTHEWNKLAGAVRMGELVARRLGIDDPNKKNTNTLRRLSDALARQASKVPASTLCRNVSLYRMFAQGVFVPGLDNRLSVLYELLPLTPELRTVALQWTRNSPNVTVATVRQFIAARKQPQLSQESVLKGQEPLSSTPPVTLAEINRQMTELTNLAGACPECPESIRERLAEVAALIHQIAEHSHNQ